MPSNAINAFFAFLLFFFIIIQSISQYLAHTVAMDYQTQHYSNWKSGCNISVQVKSGCYLLWTVQRVILVCWHTWIFGDQRNCFCPWNLSIAILIKAMTRAGVKPFGEQLTVEWTVPASPSGVSGESPGWGPVRREAEPSPLHFAKTY